MRVAWGGKGSLFPFFLFFFFFFFYQNLKQARETCGLRL